MVIFSNITGNCCVFAIEVCAYAIVSSHYHVIFHVDADTVKNWDQTEVIKRSEVIKRWRKLSGGGVLLERYLAGQCKTNAQLDKVAETAEIFLPFRSQSI
jgi:hypothetical protein